MTRTEIKWVAALLREVIARQSSDRYAGESMYATVANVELDKLARKHLFPGEKYEDGESEQDGTIEVDNSIAHYILRRFMEKNGLTDADLADVGFQRGAIV